MCILGFSAYAYTRHTVKRGETLYGIAYHYHVSPEDIVKHNPQAAQGIKRGMELLIPDGTDPEPEASIPTPEPSKKDISDTAKDAKADKPKDEKPSPVTHWASNVYETKGQESFAGISAKTGVSEDLLIEYNPFLDPFKVNPGTLVRLTEDAPMSSASKPADVAAAKTVAPEVEPEPLPEENPITILPQAPTVEAITDEDGTENEEETIVSDELGHRNILLLLPFMADSETSTRAAQQYADFYRGFLIAANELCEDDKAEVEIIALDTRGDIEKVKDQLQFTSNRDIAVVIAPDEEKQMREIIDSATKNGIYVFNIFDFKNEEYKNNPYIIQANIPQQLMYEKAVEGLKNDFNGYTPVILTALEARDEKTPFVNFLKESYSQDGQEVLDITFEGSLTVTQLDTLANSDNKYLFIPRSGAQAVFNRFAPALRQLFATDVANSKYGLFGYPDWIAYRGESLEILQELGAEIYSRFTSNESNIDSRQFQNQFEQWYGRQMIESVPYQSILGFDTGKYLIGALQNGNIQNKLDSSKGYKGVQSAFRFLKPQEDGGYVNDALFILKFIPGQNFIAKVL